MKLNRSSLVQTAAVAVVVFGAIASTVSWASIIKLSVRPNRTACEAHRCDALGGCPDGCGCTLSGGCATVSYKAKPR